MEPDVKQSAELTQSTDIYQLVAWAHANRQRLIIIVSVVAVVGLGFGLYSWHTSSREIAANDALSALKLPSRATGVLTGATADDYLKVSSEYQGTSAAARALLMSAGTAFDAGNFTQAEQTFGKFIQEYPEYPLVSQAQLGIAACLEAEGKTADATVKYKEFRERHSTDSTMPQASAALARLYTAQGKPDQALKIYEEMVKGRGNDSWTEEASILAEELLAKHPELRPQPVPAPMPTPAPTVMPPAGKPVISTPASGAATPNAAIPLKISTNKP